nr:MAG: hypothetical protein [Bacteriophage sp.]
MNFNLVEMYNGLLRFNKHILNELAEGLKHLPNLDGVSKGDSLIINEQGNPAWGSAAFIPTFENAAYGIEWTKDDNDIIRIGNAKFHRELPIQNRLKGCVYNEKKISYFLNPTGWAKPLENGLIPPLDGSDGDVGGGANIGSGVGSGCFHSHWVRSVSDAHVGFFTTVKLD